MSDQSSINEVSLKIDIKNMPSWIANHFECYIVLKPTPTDLTDSKVKTDNSETESWKKPIIVPFTDFNLTDPQVNFIRNLLSNKVKSKELIQLLECHMMNHVLTREAIKYVDNLLASITKIDNILIYYETKNFIKACKRIEGIEINGKKRRIEADHLKITKGPTLNEKKDLLPAILKRLNDKKQNFNRENSLKYRSVVGPNQDTTNLRSRKAATDSQHTHRQTDGQTEDEMKIDKKAKASTAIKVKMYNTIVKDKVIS